MELTQQGSREHGPVSSAGVCAWFSAEGGQLNPSAACWLIHTGTAANFHRKGEPPMTSATATE